MFSDNLTLSEKQYSEELSDLAVLKIETNPEDAQVYIDDVYKGVTDITLKLPSVGPHKILIQKPGYEDISYSLRIKKNTKVEIDAKLEVIKGLLIIKTIPEDAEITADGQTVSHGENKLPIGSYTIIAKKDGWLPAAETVRLLKGAPQTVELTLSPAEGSEPAGATPHGC